MSTIDGAVEEGVATWIASSDRILYARVHLPATGSAQGAVILVNSLGREQVVAFRALRMLAIRLARQGFVVIRPDLTGVGESSALPPKTDPAALWASDVDACARYVRESFGQESVHAVGLRVGAAIVAEATEINGLRVYWEAISGKRWLRHQAVLRKVSVPVPPVSTEACTEIAGVLYDDVQAAGLRRIDIPAAQVATASEIHYREASKDDATRLHSTVTLFARVPTHSLDNIVGLFPTSSRTILPGWSPTRTATIVDPDGTNVREQIVLVGHHQLVGVVTEPVDSSVTPCHRSVVFASGSAEPKDGPTALWVYLARRATHHGIRSLRIDRRGSGDMANPDDVMDPNPYLPSAVEDFAEAARFMSRTYGSPVSAVGFCSGSWVLMRAALHGPYDEIIGVAQAAWRRSYEYYARIDREILAQLDESAGPDQQDVSDDNSDRRASVRLKKVLRQKLPYAIWRELGRWDRATCPEFALREARRHAQVTLLFGAADRRTFDYERGPESLDRLRRTNAQVETIDLGPLDHALLAHTGRIAVTQAVLHLLDSRMPSR